METGRVSDLLIGLLERIFFVEKLTLPMDFMAADARSGDRSSRQVVSRPASAAALARSESIKDVRPRTAPTGPSAVHHQALPTNEVALARFVSKRLNEGKLEEAVQELISATQHEIDINRALQV